MLDPKFLKKIERRLSPKVLRDSAERVLLRNLFFTESVKRVPSLATLIEVKEDEISSLEPVSIMEGSNKYLFEIKNFFPLINSIVNVYFFFTKFKVRDYPTYLERIITNPFLSLDIIFHRKDSVPYGITYAGEIREVFSWVERNYRFSVKLGLVFLKRVAIRREKREENKVYYFNWCHPTRFYIASPFYNYIPAKNIDYPSKKDRFIAQFLISAEKGLIKKYRKYLKRTNDISDFPGTEFFNMLKRINYPHESSALFMYPAKAVYWPFWRFADLSDYPFAYQNFYIFYRIAYLVKEKSHINKEEIYSYVNESFKFALEREEEEKKRKLSEEEKRILYNHIFIDRCWLYGKADFGLIVGFEFRKNSS